MVQVGIQLPNDKSKKHSVAWTIRLRDVSNAKMSTDEKFQNSILRRLDILIALQLDNVSANGTATSGKIERLLSIGASAAEAAKIVGKPINYVTAVMAVRKKRGGVPGRGRSGKWRRISSIYQISLRSSFACSPS
jgi:hypothetical protein